MPENETQLVLFKISDTFAVVFSEYSTVSLPLSTIQVLMHLIVIQVCTCVQICIHTDLEVSVQIQYAHGPRAVSNKEISMKG